MKKEELPVEIALNGSDWRFKDFKPGYGRGCGIYKPNYDFSKWLPGTVPGVVQNDLLSNKKISEPYYGTNSKDIEWVPNREWVYRKNFRIDKKFRRRNIRLCFEGIDYTANFYLNEKYLGFHEGMFSPIVFDVSKILKFHKDNNLMVTIDPAPPDCMPYIRNDKTYKVRYIRDIRVHKTRMCYGWDFAPRLIPLGIWDDVKLLVTGSVYIEDVFVKTDLSLKQDKAKISLFTELNSEIKKGVIVKVEVFSEDMKCMELGGVECSFKGKRTVTHSFVINNPKLWWPNGSGEQSLYKVIVSVICKDDMEILDKKITNFGIRKIKLVSNERVNPKATPWTFEVNGKKVFIKGWNWTPIDQMYGRITDRRYEILLRLVKEANVNLLRVNGVGLIEKKIFYDLCNRYGIMVWQEFSLSCEGPSYDPEYLTLLKNESEEIVRNLRNHPSLVLWCGGNELWVEYGIKKETFETCPSIKILKTTCQRLDPQRVFKLTSPVDSKKHYEVHGGYFYEGLTKHYKHFNNSKALFHSEYGVPALSSLKSLQMFIPQKSLWPIYPDNPVWIHHNAFEALNQPSWLCMETLKEIFGEIKTLQKAIRASQFIQLEGLRYGIEQNRRRKYQCSGSIPWQFNEPWPTASCTNVIDWYLRPKMAYYYVTKAYEPVHISTKYDSLMWLPGKEFKAEIWISNSLGDMSNLSVEYSLSSLNGNLFNNEEFVISMPCNTSRKIREIRWKIPQGYKNIFILFLSLKDEGDKIISQNAYLYSSALEPAMKPLLTVPKTLIDIEEIGELETNKDNGVGFVNIKIVNRGKSFALFVEIEVELDEDFYAYINNNFEIIPPESSQIIFMTFDTKHLLKEKKVNAELTCQGWNTNIIKRSIKVGYDF